MLKVRLISSLVGLLIMVILIKLGEIALALGVFGIAIIGLYEFYKVFDSKNIRTLHWIGYIFAFAIPMISMQKHIETLKLFLRLDVIFLILFITVVSSLIALTFKFQKISVTGISITFFGVFYIVFFLSFIVLTRMLPDGLIWIWMIFIGAWITDTFAYFGGKAFGRIKILPIISPNKTLEGALIGILGCTAASAFFGYIWNPGHIALHHFVFLGLCNGIVSQFGDWSASAIKRSFDVKDYGTLMPGHGGVLDRFDSILFTAPTVYFYLHFILS